MTRVALGMVLWVALALTSHARNFYIDSEAVGLGDGSSWTNAWTQLGYIEWRDIKPGDSVMISGGTNSKTYSGNITIPKSGAAGQPITITVDSQDPLHNGVVVINSGYISLINQQYITISGNVNGQPHLRLQNFFSTENRTFANAILADSTFAVTVEYVEAFNVNQMVSLVGATQFAVRHCLGREIRGDAAVRAVNCHGTGFNVNFVEDNLFELARDSSTGFGPDGVQGSDSLTIRNNIFTVKNVDYFTSQQHTDYCQVTGNYIIVSGNDFINIGDSAIDMDWWVNPTPHDIWIYNNIFRITGEFDPYPEYIRFYSSQGAVQSITNLKIFNNTFLDNPWVVITGPGGNASTASCVGLEIKNNIFINPGSVYYIQATPNFTQESCSFASNLYNGGSILYQGTNYDIGNGWLAIEPTRIEAAPQFVCYIPRSSGNDLRLAYDDKAAKGQGADLSSFFAVDKGGGTRPTGAPWDVGAYQAALTPPESPPPVIKSHPTSFDSVLGSVAKFQVSAEGTALSYQWRFNNFEIPGANTNELVIDGVRERDFGRYSVQVSNANGCVLSDSADLFLYVDTDGDGLTDRWEWGIGRYRIIAGAFTWSEAKADAEARGGHLATVLSDAEWDGIRDAVPNVLDEPRWIGLRREADQSDWRWITEEPFSYARWAADRPNTADKAAAVVELTPVGSWKDIPESDDARHSYLFEISYFTDPQTSDTDGDGYSDGAEENFYHTIPTSPLSRPRIVLTNSGISSSGAFVFYANGETGAKYRIERSTNLVDWETFLELTLPVESVPLGDEPDGQPGGHFYRAVALP